MDDDKESDPPVPSPEGPTELLLYQSEDGQTRIEVRLVGETLWLTQNQMAELFQVNKSGISRHLKSIYETGELSPETVVAEFAATAADGKTYQVEHYGGGGIAEGSKTGLQVFWPHASHSRSRGGNRQGPSVRRSLARPFTGP